MNEFIRNLINKIDLREGWFGNERDLAKLDAESLELQLEKYEDRIEDLEWSEEDYYQIDKDDMDIIVTRAMRKMLFTDDGDWVTLTEEEYSVWLEDAIIEIKEHSEIFNKNKEATL